MIISFIFCQSELITEISSSSSYSYFLSLLYEINEPFNITELFGLEFSMQKLDEILDC